MYDPKNVQFRIKVMTNKQKTKVIYAEADSEFIDVLLSFLTLPLGTIVRVLQKHDPSLLLGSLTTMYKGLAALDNVYFEAEICKQMLLNPRTSFESARHKLKLNLDDSDQPAKYFRCASLGCDSSYVSMYNYGIPCSCGKSTLCKEIVLKSSIGANGEVFTTRTSHFIISDDLQLLPCVTGDAIRFLSSLGITDMEETELMDVTFGFKEIIHLLKGSLFSETPLTDIVLNKKTVSVSAAAKYEMGTSLLPIKQKTPCNDKKFFVKAILQKSANKLLFVEGDDKFVEFLFTLLTIPLGGIECLLGGNTKLKNIDNIYRTLRDINCDKYLTYNTKPILLNPKLPHGYTSNNDPFLPLIEESPSLSFHRNSVSEEYYLSYWYSGRPVFYKSPKGQGNFVKRPAMFMVTDDLVVTPLCTTSSLSIINRLKVPLSDVRELELCIRMEEALRIVRASLTSRCALFDGLVNLILMKQPKQEQGE